MSNNNCLKYMQCPKCKSFGPFNIQVLLVVTMYDDGSDTDNGECEWDDDSFCECIECNHHGTAKDFKTTQCTWCHKESHEVLTPIKNATYDTSYIYVCKDCIDEVLEETPEAEIVE